MTMKKALAVLMVAVMLVASFSIVGSAAGTYTIVEGPLKTAYTDCEYFNPQGLTITNGTEIIAYSPVDDKWAFDPALNEFLSVGVDADGNDVFEQYIEIFYDNQLIGTVVVGVDHALGDVTFLGDAGHGQYCLGCGKVHNYEEHSIPVWIPNDDGGLFVNQTQTGTCEICNGKVTESIPDTDKFITIFNPETMTDTEAEIVGYIYTILVSLIQMLVGIK
jgi:hypothetical protein